MIKTVIFDLDNTLYSYDRAHAAAWAALLSLAEERLGLGEERFRALHAEASRVLTRRCGGGPAIHNRLIRFQILLELAGLPIGAAPELADCYWDVLLDRLEPEPGAAETLGALRALGLRIGVGTNMTADRQFEKLRRLGLLPLVDFLVTSEELGVEKPDPRLFTLCAEKAGVPLRCCAFVGDSLQKDALAALAAGMRGIWYRPVSLPEPVPEEIPAIRSLTELPALCAALNRN
jgi:putative hydrolase of the HAD superfamily